MIREVINFLKVKVFDEELRHYEVVEFIKEKGLEKTPVLLNVEGRRVAKNFICTRELLCKYLGIEKIELCKYLANLGYGNVEISNDFPLKEVDVNLEELPILKYYSRDGGRYITAGVVIAKDVDAEVKPDNFNASIHRMMLLGKNKLVARLVEPRHTYLLWRSALEKGRDLPIAIVIGVHPLFLFASATRLPFGKEFAYASSLMGGLKVYKIEDLLVPPAEIVLIGRITDKLEDEGPFVDITGTYDKVRKQPVIEIDRMFIAEDYIYYSITPASYEHMVLMGIPYEPLIYRAVSNVCKVKNVVMTYGSRCYFHAIVQIEKITEGDGKNAILAALSANPSLKGVIVVDDDINIYDHEDVEYAIATRFQADKDFVVIKGARGSSLDPSADETTAKWGIDATKYLKRKEDFERIL
jgi:UbiD family decarboxylase